MRVPYSISGTAVKKFIRTAQYAKIPIIITLQKQNQQIHSNSFFKMLGLNSARARSSTEKLVGLFTITVYLCVQYVFFGDFPVKCVLEIMDIHQVEGTMKFYVVIFVG